MLLARTLTTRSRPNRSKVAYLLTTVLLYGLIFFLLLSVLITVFHNVQYLGPVWFYNRNRYGAASSGAGLVDQPIADVFPGSRIFTFTLGTITASQIGLCLWWGLALQHYYDQRTWRLSADAALKRHLKLV